tara:strand:- start:4028 stop:4879 length:852 start_codon:yes stop_codon:yes gene_type:complete
MSLYITTWSAATAFNRCNEFGASSDPVVCVDQDSLPPRFEDRSDLATHGAHCVVNIIADVIRELGYAVTCGIWTQYGHRRPSAEDNYIIMNIQNTDGEYIYGCSLDDEEWLGQCTQRRPLIGNQTTRHWDNWYTKDKHGKPSVREDELVAAINTGGRRFIKNSQVTVFYSSETHSLDHEDKDPASVHMETGVSTIGNTLPADIVAALRDFRHDDVAFRTEGEWEYYIPEFMRKEQACPVAEEVVTTPSTHTSTEYLLSNEVPPAAPPSDTNITEDSSSDDDDE